MLKAINKLDNKIGSLQKELEELKNKKVEREDESQSKVEETTKKKNKEEKEDNLNVGKKIDISNEENKMEEFDFNLGVSSAKINKIPVEYNETEIKIFNSETIHFDFNFTNMILKDFNKYHFETVSTSVSEPLTGEPKIILNQKVLYPDFFIPEIKRVAAQGFKQDVNQIARVIKKIFILNFFLC